MTSTSRATLADVAAAADVDRSTASRVLNDGTGHRVGAATRDRVLAAAKALGYAPNPLARGLRTARSHALGIAVPQLENPVFPEIIFGAEAAARARGYALLIAHSDDAEGDARHYARMALVSRVDGLLVATLENDETLLQSLQQTSLPYVVLNRKLAGGANHVVFDSFAAARLATEHLVALGHRRIAHLAGRAEGYNGQQRLAGYRAALAAAGIAFDPALVVIAGYTVDGGEAGMRLLIDSGTALTAVVAATLLTAAGAMKLLHARGVPIPLRMSIIAIHDAAIADVLHPQLSTVRLPLREMGAVATHGLIDLVEHKTGTIERTLPLERLVLRASTGPPPA